MSMNSRPSTCITSFSSFTRASSEVLTFHLTWMRNLVIDQVNAKFLCVTSVSHWNNDLSLSVFSSLYKVSYAHKLGNVGSCQSSALINREALGKPLPLSEWMGQIYGLKADSALKSHSCFSYFACPSECLFSSVLPISSPLGVWLG